MTVEDLIKELERHPKHYDVRVTVLNTPGYELIEIDRVTFSPALPNTRSSVEIGIIID